MPAVGQEKQFLLIHGTAIAIETATGPRAALIRGSSGSGKSDLSLRCLAVPPNALSGSVPRLVADDQVVVTPVASDTGVILMVSAPQVILGQLEVRGIGVIEVPVVALARLVLVVDLVPPAQVERMPEIEHCVVAGVQVRRLALAPFEASSALKLLLCLNRLRL
jgi:HPr kinase/phosphorylase